MLPKSWQVVELEVYDLDAVVFNKLRYFSWGLGFAVCHALILLV
jgi:hypothetical protein